MTGLGTVLCFTSVAASIAVASLLSRFDKVFGLFDEWYACFDIFKM